MGLGSIVGSIAGPIIGSVFNKHESDKNRDWQTQMSNTSIQRRVEDLEAAGFNKLYAVDGIGSGASTPSVAPYQADMGVLQNAFNFLLEKKKVDAEVDNVKAKTDNTRADTVNKELETVSKRLDNVLKQNDINVLDFKNKILAAQTEQEFNKVIYSALNNEHLSQQNKALVVRTAREMWDLDISKRDPLNSDEGLRLKYMNEFNKNPWTSGMNILDRIEQGIGNSISNFGKSRNINNLRNEVKYR
nr:MAG: DNA pilot protein [Microvirus Sku118]